MRMEGVIFDVDGTLVDSNDAHAKAWRKALSEHGVSVHLPEIRRMIGCGGDKILPALAGVPADSEDGKAISARRGEVFREEYLPTLRAFPGARELLLALGSRGLRLGVASSAKPEELGPLLRIAQVSDLIEQATSSADAPKSKPAPDIVEAACLRMGIAPEAMVMIGDTPYDVEAALSANVHCIAVRSGGWADADLKGTMAIYDDVADLLARIATSPFG